MAGYYDEINGTWEDTGDDSYGYSQLDDTSGTGTVGDYTDVQTFDDGSTLIMDLNGNVIGSTPATDGSATSAADILKSAGAETPGFFNWLSKNITPANLQKMVSSNAGALTGLAGLYSMMGGNKITNQNGGYSGTIPAYSAVRSPINYDDTNRRPGSEGRQYFTPTQFVAPGSAAAAQAAADTQARGLAAAAPAIKAQSNPYEGKFATPWAKSAPAATAAPAATETYKTIPTAQEVLGMATGGLASGRYLRGATDGMADKINTSIDGEQPAKLSHGEFVVPADVVSHLGNGNSDAGARKLYAMMDKVRHARTGTKKQGKQINPDKFMPGGLATSKYAGGGVVAFNTGGTTPSSGVTTTAPTSTPGYGTSSSSTLSPWAGDYVTDMLAKGKALSEQPYQQYKGPLTAGASDLQQQQFAGLSDIAKTGLAPTQYTTGTFDTAQANKYMNPYLQASLDPQLAELRRQAQIANVADASKLTQGGAYGGGRQAVLMGEQNRNLLDKTNALVSSGYNTAFDKAMAQFNAEQNRGLDTQRAQQAANEASANFGLKSLDALGAAGATQREIEQQGITADKLAFEAERDAPYKMVQYQQGLLQGLPITTNTTTPNQTDLSRILTQTSDLTALYNALKALGIGG